MRVKAVDSPITCGRWNYRTPTNLRGNSTDLQLNSKFRQNLRETPMNCIVTVELHSKWNYNHSSQRCFAHLYYAVINPNNKKTYSIVLQPAVPLMTISKIALHQLLSA